MAPQIYTGIREEQERTGKGDAGDAFFATAAGMALEFIGGTGAAVTSRLTREASAEAQRGVAAALKRVGREGVTTMGQEGLVEMAQTALERQAAGKDLTSPEAINELLNAGFVGLIGGGAVGTTVQGGKEITAALRRGNPEATALAADPAIRAEFQRLASQEVAIAMRDNPELDRQAAVDAVSERAEELLARAALNVVGVEGETDVAADADTAVDVPGGGVAGTAPDLGAAPPAAGTPDLGEAVAGRLGEPLPSVPVPDAGAGAGVAPLAPVTGKQIKTMVPTIEQAFDANAIDFEDAYGVKKLNAEQKKQAARIVLQSPEVDPYDAINSVLERGARLKGETPVAPTKAVTPSTTGLLEMGSNMGAALGESFRNALLARVEAGEVTETRGGQPSALLQAAKLIKDAGVPVDAAMLDRIQGAVDSARETGNFNAAMRAFVADTVQRASRTAPAAPSVDEVAVAPVKAAIETATAPAPVVPGAVPSLAQASAREVGITPTPVAAAPNIGEKSRIYNQASSDFAVGLITEDEFRAKVGLPPVEPAPPAPSATITPAPAPTPQQIAENLQGFATQEAQDRGLDVPMFREGARDVQRGLEPIPDQQILDEQGPEFLDAYKAGQQWAQERVAEAQAAPVEAAPVEAAPVEAAPVEAAPVEAAPVEAAPVEAAPVEAAPAPEETPKQRFNRIKTELAARVQEAGALTGSTWVNSTARSLTSQEGPVTTADYDTAINDYVTSNPSARSGADTRTAPDQTFEDIPENTTNLTEEPRTTDIYGLAEELPEAERVNVRARLDRIMANYAKDGDVQRLLGSLEALREDVERRIDRDRAKRTRDRVRGFERAMEVIYRAERTGQLTPEAANLVRWLLEQNPAIADELALSLRLGGTDSPAGQYVPASRIATIFTSRANDGTAAHEVLHHAERLMPDNVRDGIRAAWMKRIQDLIALAERTDNTDMREVLGAIVSAYYGDAQAQKVLRESFESGSIPYSVYHLSNPSEFWAVNATDLVGKRANRTGWIGAARNWVRGLVERAKDFFGLPNDAAVIAGLNAVLEAESGTIRGQMLSAATTQFMDQTAPEDGGTAPLTTADVDAVVSVRLTKAQIKQLEEAAGIRRMRLNAMQKRIAQSRNPEETLSLAGKLMLIARNPDTNVNVLTSLFNSIPPSSLSLILSFAQTDDVVRLAERAGMANIGRVDAMVRDEYVPYIHRLMNRASRLAEEWAEFTGNSPEGADAMADVMFFSNMVDADPSLAPNANAYLKLDPTYQDLTARYQSETDPKKKSNLKGEVTKRRGEIQRLYSGGADTDPSGNPIIVKGWNDVPPEGKQIFRKARDHYRQDFNEHYRLLMQRIDDAGFKPERAAQLKESVDKMFADANKRMVYFPMKRFGEYWVSIGKGASGEFHMFESFVSQQAFITRRRLSGDTRPVSSGFGRGSLRKLRGEVSDISDALKGVLDLIDTGTATDPELLRDGVFQLYLSALPEADMRRRFIHRQFKTGFSTDMLRTFATTAIASANQLGRLAYNGKFKNLIDQSYAETEGNPAKPRLDALTDEMDRRLTATLSGDADTFFTRAANGFAKGTFLWLLSSVKSAFMNLTQLHFTGFPVLTAEFGEVATTAMAARYTGQLLTGQRIAYAVRDEEGNVKLNAPKFTAQSSAYIRGLQETDPDRYEAMQRAWLYGEEREVTQSTFTSAQNIYEITNKPAGELGFTQAVRAGDKAQATKQAIGNTIDGMGGMFHHSERIGREIMYMSAFELAYDRNLKQGMDSEAAADAAMALAVKLTNNGMFDFSNWNKPRAFKTPVGRVALQMRGYSFQMTSLLLRSGFNLIAAQRTKGQRLAAARVFFGVAGMTTLYAGLRANQFFLLGMGAYGIYKFFESLMEDDDEEDEVTAEDIEREYMKFADEQGRELTKKDMDYYIRTVWIPETFGPGSGIQDVLGLSDENATKLARVADIGLPALAGVDISNSVALTNLWHPVETKSDNAEAASFEALGRAVIGPSGSFITAWNKTVEEANKGNYGRAIEATLPAIVRNYVKSERLQEEGLRVGKDQDIILRDPSFYDTYTSTMQALGFPEAETSRAMQLDIAAGDIEREVAQERTDLLDKRYQVILDMVNNPSEDVDRQFRAIERDIQIYSLNYPSNAIDEDTKQRSFEQKQAEAAERMYGLGLNPKIPVRQPLVEERAAELGQ
jgi:hypothetical protein